MSFIEEHIGSFLTYWCQHVSYAPYVFFGLLVLSGLNLPVGEEPLLIFAGVLVAHCALDEALWMWMWLYAGTVIAAYITYWIGRTLGPQVQRLALFRHLVDPRTIAKMGPRIRKYGLLAFLLGRFCPGGIRNALFFTSGWTRLPFKTFIIRDGIGALCSTTTFFVIGIELSEHATDLLREFRVASHWMAGVSIIVFVSCLGAWGWERFVRRARK